jgi:hypothetical protein
MKLCATTFIVLVLCSTIPALAIPFYCDNAIECDQKTIRYYTSKKKKEVEYESPITKKTNNSIIKIEPFLIHKFTFEIEKLLQK